MGRLIDADALLKEWRLECCGECCWGHDRRCIHFDLNNDACTLITEAPTIELKPIVIDGEEYLTGADYNNYLKGYNDGYYDGYRDGACGKARKILDEVEE